MAKSAPPETSRATVRSRLSDVNWLARQFFRLQSLVASLIFGVVLIVLLGLQSPSAKSPLLELARLYPIPSVVGGATVLALNLVALLLTRQVPTRLALPPIAPQTTKPPEEPLDEEERRSRLRTERIAQVRQWIAEDGEFAAALKTASLLPWRGRQVIVIGAGTLGFVANIVGLAAIFFPHFFPQH